MHEPTGFYDDDGIPIYIGDLIRVPHYRHYQRRRKMWLYFRVAEHPKGNRELVAQNWFDLDKHSYQCLLQAAISTGCEVLQEAGVHKLPNGEIMTFNERPRRKKGAK